jgi:transcriptional regulator with XRE-family HTH domain
VSTFAENLRQAIFNKRCKAVDVSRGTNIRPSVISRYLSGTNQPSTGNLFAIAEYLGVSPNTLLSSSEAPESAEGFRFISSDKDKIIAVQEELIKNLQKQIQEWEDWKASSKERHAKGKAKADLAIAKNKNTLRINTTRKRKK